MLNKQTVCGILRPFEWQEYLQASEKLSALLQPSHIRSPFDSLDEKETVSSASTPTPPRRSAFSFPFFLFLRCLLLFFFQRQALKMGRDTSLVSMAWIMLALLPDRVVYWCVWHSKWGIFSNLGKAQGRVFIFIPYRKQNPGTSERMPLSFPTQPPSLCSLPLRPLALNLLTSLMGAETKPSARWAVKSASSPLLPKQGPSSPSCGDENPKTDFSWGRGLRWTFLGGVGSGERTALESGTQPQPTRMNCVVLLFNPPCSVESWQRNSSLCSERTRNKHRYWLYPSVLRGSLLLSCFREF